MAQSRSIPFYSPEEEQPVQLSITFKVGIGNQTILISVADTSAKTQLVEDIIMIYNALCQSCGYSYLKVPIFDKNLEKERRIRRGKRGGKRKKHEGGVCEGQYWSQSICLDKRNNVCFFQACSFSFSDLF